jgi:4-hydroxy-2-oxoheptanedioate aldolase
MQTQPNLAIAELVGICGYDFLILDGEHGLFSEADYVQTLQTLAASEVTALVRLATHDLHAVGRYLDVGADGIVVPSVTGPEQATALVRAMQYPPAGTRGFGATAHRATRYGMDVAVHVQTPRAGACLLLMIEDRVGVDNVESILAVEGVDGVFVGPFDLTASLGAAGNFSMPAYSQALARIERAASSCGKIIGTVPHPGHPLESLLSTGHRLLLIGGDMPLIREAMSSQVTAAKATLKHLSDGQRP